MEKLLIIIAVILGGILTTDSPLSSFQMKLDLDLDIKEFHFHVYFDQNNPAATHAAVQLFEAVKTANKEGYFITVPLRINYTPVGPHPIGSYEVWCPWEYFAKAYNWFLLKRGDLSVLVHPLTKFEILDHTERAVWMGKSYSLKLDALTWEYDEIPLQYPELGLGYSAKTIGE